MTKRQTLQDFYTANSEFELTNGTAGASFGRSTLEYRIYKHADVRNLKYVNGYLLMVRQRIIIPNQSRYSAGSTSISTYDNYPAAIENCIKLKTDKSANIRLLSAFPRTLNSTITTNASSLNGNSNSVTHQTSAGSSNTNVNTFGVELSAGIFGELPVAGIALSYSHAWGSETSRQTVDGSNTAQQSERGYGSGMSVKDWSAYSLVGDDDCTLSWIWGQSYPWDVILYNQSSGGDNVNLPNFVKDRMISDGLVLPPSELAMFGLDFTSQVCWLIDFPNDCTEDSELVTLLHETSVFTASHRVDGGQVSAKLQSENEASTAIYNSPILDLSLFSIAPIDLSVSENPATIGFRVDRFTIAPKEMSGSFKISSAINDLLVIGKGFDPSMTSDLTFPPEITIYFKVSEKVFDYELSLIHWLGKSSGACIVNWIVNDQYLGTLTLNANESADGQSCTSRISLRKLDDFSSVNFHDYLAIGLNKISLHILPADQGTSHEYTLSAIAIR